MIDAITVTLTVPVNRLAELQAFCVGTAPPQPIPIQQAPAPSQQQPVPTQQAPAPQPTAPPPMQVPTSPPAFTHDQLSLAAAGLAEKSQQDWQNVTSLVQKYGVQGVAFLQPEQFGAFATELRALGAQI